MLDAIAWGIPPGYHDVRGRWVPADLKTVSRVLSAMGAHDGGPPPPGALVVRAGDLSLVDGPSQVVTEDGAVLPVGERLPADLPAGYHLLRRLSDGAEMRLIVSPGQCHLPVDLRGWGWAAQLYAVRSRESWGVGDLGDLRDLARWAAGLGAAALLLNPLDAALPLIPQEASPYYPSSRRFRNPLYIRVEEVPGAERLGERLAPLAQSGRALNERRRIDRDRVYQLKMLALEELFMAFTGGASFDRYRAAAGAGLEDYATFCALTEVYGGPWRTWPPGLRHPSAPDVARFRQRYLRRVRYHQWLQWLLDEQLARAAQEIGLVHDLPVGSQPDGADAWAWQDTLTPGVSIGAPPDPFNPGGQNWAIPPFDPWKLRATGYEPFIQTVRAALRHGAGLRVDHVMGLFRLFWIPAGCAPDQGAYVRYHYHDLLGIIALESQRAGTFVVGEDLGTVEDVVRKESAEHHILSYRLLWFEDRPPAHYPSEAVAAVTTHDLPTVAGIWERSDPDESIRARLRRLLGISDDLSTIEVAEAAYRALARGPCRLVAATLEDALGVRERPNKPGTKEEWPNWSLALPLTLEELGQDPRPYRLAAALRR